MSRTVDDKVVAMSFESSKFETGVGKTLSALDKLKAALHFPNAGRGLNDINSAAGRVDFSRMAAAIDGIKSKFSAMSVVALSVLANVANRALAAGANVVKGLTLDPLLKGFSEYETNLNAVQTILANTSASGAGLDDVNAALEELNHYSDQTIYNFSEMAKNIGTFTAAGVDLDTATGAIKGIANLAAVSGSNSQQASTAMYQLSQAIASGRVSLQDWNSVVNAGMGGTVFQRALAQTAERMGTLSDGSVKLTGKMKNVSIAGESFRESIQAKPGKESWLTSDVLTKTLEQFTGDMTDAELAAQGFSKAQIKAIQDQAKMAVKAATEVKTLSGVLDTARESAGSGWAKTWQIVFGDFGEAKTLFTGVSTAINGFISSSADARNKVLGDWKELGGRTLLIEGIKDAFNAVKAVIEPVKDAFRDIFPPTTGQDLFNLTKRFADFTKTLAPSTQTIDNIRRTFRGVFALFSIGKTIVSGIFGVFKRLFGVLGEGSGGFLDFTGNIGDFIVAIDKALKNGEGLGKFFDKIGDILEVPIRKVKDFASALLGLGGSFDGTKAAEGFVGILGELGEALKPLADGIKEVFGDIGSAIADSLSTANFDQVMEVIKTGLLGGIFVTIRNFLKGGFPGASLMDSIAGTFDGLTGSLTAMQNNIKADSLQKIAIAVGILAASMIGLSLIDPAKLTSALTAMTVAFGQLMGALALLSTIGTTGFLKIPFIAGALILLATAVAILTVAVKNLSSLSWEELAKGLIGVGVLLGAVSAAAIPLSANAGGMIRAGAGIIAIAVAMKILASAVRDFGSMSWTEIGKGLASVAVALGAIGAASRLFPSGMVTIGIGLLALSAALLLLSKSVEAFGNMDWSTIGKGLGTIAATMLILAGAMLLMPPNLPITAAGLVLVGAALQIISGVVQSFGGMSIEAIAKGLGVLAGTLLILGVALIAMTATLPGSAALVVAAAALSMLAPAMAQLGGMSWGGIIKGLVALAAALTVMGVAAVILAPVAPALLAMGAALLLIGGGLALAGAGLFLIGTGLSAIAVAGPAAIAILISSLIDFAEAVPRVAESFIMGFLRIVDMLVAVAPRFVEALGTIIVTLVEKVIELAPKLGEGFLALITAALTVLKEATPQLISAGEALLLAMLTGIRNNISRVTRMAIDIVIRFLSTITANLGRIIRAGAELLTRFITGVGSVYNRVIAAGTQVVVKIIGGISNAHSRIVRAATDLIVRFLGSIANAGVRIVSAGVNMVVRLITGIGNATGRLVNKAVEIAGKFVSSVAKGLVKLADEGAKAIINFLNGIAAVINNRSGEMRAAGVNIASAIISGFLGGLNASDIVSAVANKFRGAIDAAKRAVGAKSPATEFIKIGQYVVQGFALGLENTPDADYAIQNMANGIINGFKSVFQIQSPSKVTIALGKLVGDGFAKGLLGSQDDITNAISNLNTKLGDAIRDAREKLLTEQAKLDKLRKARKPDKSAIKEATAVIKETQITLNTALAARTKLTKGLKKEAEELKANSKLFDETVAKLEEAQKKLEDATKARDDFNASISEKYGSLPEIDEDAKDQLGAFKTATQKQIDAVTKYQQTLAALRSLGLDDRTYRMLLEEGTAGQKFADQLLAGGPDAVASVNALSSQLATAAGTLGQQASTELYQAGVNAAQGLVNGLIAERDRIAGVMAEIADAMVKAIKKKLKIKSPSRVFAEVGKFSAQGMADGLTDSTKVVVAAAEDMAKGTVNSLADTMSRLMSASGIEVDPTITPILDLSQMRKDAGVMNDLLDASAISAARTYGQAAAIAAIRTSSGDSPDSATSSEKAQVVFNQTNNSPKALSEVEIYRKTRNQLSQLKEVLV